MKLKSLKNILTLTAASLFLSSCGDKDVVVENPIPWQTHVVDSMKYHWHSDQDRVNLTERALVVNINTGDSIEYKLFSQNKNHISDSPSWTKLIVKYNHGSVRDVEFKNTGEPFFALGSGHDRLSIIYANGQELVGIDPNMMFLHSPGGSKELTEGLIDPMNAMIEYATLVNRMNNINAIVSYKIDAESIEKEYLNK